NSYASDWRAILNRTSLGSGSQDQDTMQGRPLSCAKEGNMSQEAIALKHADGSEPQPHQVGQNIFKTILSEDVDWEPFPAFPPSIRLAVVVGQPADPGPYTIRVKVPNGGKLMPHKYPEDRVYTVIS